MNSKITKQQIHKFLGYYKPHRGIFALALSFSALTAICVLLFPLISGYITGKVLNGFHENTMKELIIAGIVLLAAGILLVFLCIPKWAWLALLGILLIAAGFVLLRIGQSGR